MKRSLADLMFRQDSLCDVLDRVHEVSMFMLEHADGWIGETGTDG